MKYDPIIENGAVTGYSWSGGRAFYKGEYVILETYGSDNNWIRTLTTEGRIISARQGPETLFFDSNGSLSSKVDYVPGGLETTISFDAIGHKASGVRKLAGATVATSTFSFHTNADGLLVENEVSTDGSTGQTIYSAAGTVMAKSWTDADGSVGSETHINGVIEGTVTHANGDITVISGMEGGAREEIRTTPAGDLVSRVYRSGHSYTRELYHSDGSSSGAGTYSLGMFTYTYDVDGNETGNTYSFDGVVTEEYFYGVDGDYWSISYDANGVEIGKEWETPALAENGRWVYLPDGSRETTVYTNAAFKTVTVDSVDGTSNVHKYVLFGEQVAERHEFSDGSVQQTRLDATGAVIASFELGSNADEAFDFAADSIFVRAGGGDDAIVLRGGSRSVSDFQVGHGHDTLSWTGDTSFGLIFDNSIDLTNVFLKRVGLDLLIQTGANDSLTLKNWYSSGTDHSDQWLEFGGVQQLATVSLSGLVERFDNAMSSDPSITSWSVFAAVHELKLANVLSMAGDFAGANMDSLTFSQVDEILDGTWINVPLVGVPS